MPGPEAQLTRLERRRLERDGIAISAAYADGGRVTCAPDVARAVVARLDADGVEHVMLEPWDAGASVRVTVEVTSRDIPGLAKLHERIARAVSDCIEHGRVVCDDELDARDAAARLAADGVPSRVTQTVGRPGCWTVTACSTTLAARRPVAGETQTLRVGLDDYAADTQGGQHSMLPGLDGQGSLDL